MDPVSNPYLPGAGMPPPTLVGREELLTQVSIALHRTKAGRHSKSMMPTGLRGVGKTVFLNRCGALAEEVGFQQTFIEASEGTGFSETLANRLTNTLKTMSEGTGFSASIRRALRMLHGFSIKAATDGSVELGVKFDETSDTTTGRIQDDLPDIFVQIGLAAREHDTGVFLAVDEVQNLDQKELGALIMAQHRALQRQLPVLLVAVGLPQLPALAGEAKSYAERLFAFETIGALSHEDTKRAVREPAEDLGVTCHDDALDEIYRLTEGYPYFIQEWAHDSWNAASGSTIDLASVHRASLAVQHRLDHGFFRVRFDRLTPKEKKYLQAMATLGDGVHRSGEIADAFGGKISALGSLRDGLIKKGMIYSPAYGEAAFSVPLFGKFLERAMPTHGMGGPKL